MSPSRWTKRAPAAVLAGIGLLVAARLASYQLGWTAPPWEPFFGDGSERVLRSAFSRALPFPDAGAGALAYAVELFFILWGRADRYRTKPLAVYGYGLVATAMALGSAGLVVLQIAVVHALCTLCLASALISFGLVAPAWTEVMAASKERKKR